MFEFAFYVILLAASLVVLAIASQFTIKSIEDFIELTHLSETSVGFVLLSVMTSLPEIFVAVFSVLHGKPGFSAGDILGSNVFNIGIVVGIMATMGYFKNCCAEILVELVDILFLSSIIPLILLVYGKAHFLVGFVLLAIFAVSIREMIKRKKQPIILNGKTVGENVGRKIVFLRIIVGTAVVIVTAELMITSASNISTMFGIAPILIGAKLISIGTSLPELALDLTAVRRGRIHLALGDIIGSNLTNMTLVLGILLLLSPFETINLTLFAEVVPFVLITTLILWRYLTKGGISQIGGIALILTYVIFQAVIT